MNTAYNLNIQNFTYGNKKMFLPGIHKKNKVLNDKTNIIHELKCIYNEK